MHRLRGSSTAWAAAALLTVLAVALVVRTVDAAALADAGRRLAASPGGALVALACFGAAFALRGWAWTRVLPALPPGQAWAGVHVALLGNRLLPLRLGEPLRVVSAVRRVPGLGPAAATASTVSLRGADTVALLAVGAGAAVALGLEVRDAGGAAVAVAGLVAAAVTGGGAWWLVRLRARGHAVRPPGAAAVAATLLAWPLEAVVVLVAARAVGLDLDVAGALVVTAAAVLAQVAAVAPGGLGTYEGGAVAGYVLLGHDPATGLAAAVVTRALTTVYALVAGGVAVLAPSPSLLGRLRLPRRLPPRPAAGPAPAADAPVVLVLPAHDEAASVADVVARAPRTVLGRPVRVVVVDDGSRDGTAVRARAAGAEVVEHGRNRGLGAAVRTGLAHGVGLGAAAVAFADADGEYPPEELAAVVGPVLAGDADYVVGSRFAGRIDRMLPHRRFGNRVLTWWVRWLTRHPVTDGQSGYRALSPAAAADAEIVHDYNYAQVLTLDLLGKGYRYAEVPISYGFRTTGTSFVRLGRYLRSVVPAVHRELNA
ncbi:glycosyltransferase family 2 protein [Aquipuribacter nitratireducens]|uniref:Lysylphosphatidylglycerol synthase domain-containing protein n=1 Tax=Aquipuribacter nitratireducens TaxID=650104 RepID=A0ABW0GM25_9MICO